MSAGKSVLSYRKNEVSSYAKTYMPKNLPKKEKGTHSASLLLSVKFSPRLALGFLEIEKSDSKRLDGQFSAM